MILHLTKNQLEWEEINHYQEFSKLDTVLSILQAEIFYYKNDEITVRSTIKIIEHSKLQQPFKVHIDSYSHVHPDLVRMEFSDRKQIGEFDTLDEAKFAAQNHFNHHHHVNYQHSH